MQDCSPNYRRRRLAIKETTLVEISQEQPITDMISAASCSGGVIGF